MLNALSRRLIRGFGKTLHANAKTMSQKSITSFFQRQTPKTPTAIAVNSSCAASTTTTEKKESSPVKTNGSSEITDKITPPENQKKRKRINVGSESEDETIDEVREESGKDANKCIDKDVNEGADKYAKKDVDKDAKKDTDKNAKDDIDKDVVKEVEKEIKCEPKTELKTLSFLAGKKRPSKTPRKPAAKNTKTKENKEMDNETPVKPQKPAKNEKKAKTEKKSDEDTPADKKTEAEENKPTKKVANGNMFFTNKTSSENESILEYFPDKSNYHPVEDAPWKHRERVPYLALAKTLKKIEETSARLKIIEILSNYLRSVIVLSEDDFLPSIYLCLNSLAPAYEGLELGIADMYLMKAIAQCTGRAVHQIKADVAVTGDLGIVAEQSRSKQIIMHRPAPLTVQSVFNQLTAIAKISGNQAMKKKVEKIEALFVACRDCEARFVTRSLAGKMRIGLAEQSVLQAIALACTTTPTNQSYPPEILSAAKGISADEFKKKVDEEALVLKTTFCECPNYNMIIPVILKKGIRALPEECKITPGLPVKPMLAQPTKGAREVLERFEGMKFTCEWKYDGERAQIHLMEDGRIKIYSRNQEDNTSKYPDIISNIKLTVKSDVKSFILDTEAVAWDRDQKKIMPFQVLSTRKRKDADENEIKVSVCVFMFDLLYLNGESLVQKPLIERRQLLKNHFVEVEGKFVYVIALDTNTMEEVQECLEESVKGNCEGLMVKTLDTEATYEIAKRSRNWLKLKKDYLEGVGDTLDLVVIGGYSGKGKRTGNYGGFLLASYDEENEEYQAICKIGTGFSDEILAQHTKFLKEHIIEEAKPYYRCDASLKPDHWFDAAQVWEVKCADLSLSPVYSAAIGLVDPEKGVSLRFPRFLRIRDDKNVEQATNAQQVAELYKNQDQIKNQGTTSAFNDEDF
ncbi:DNA ligase 1 isoform X2 [Planococcus citri]|uniref:DNA ligase 1 isoform X2 n=1 Tax=Planococcus citri TaxID=170843 RepID=UPI0031F8CE59